MKVVHIESGLGNQMLSYCEFLAIKRSNPHDNCYIETIIYDIPECNETICQWNGYELDRVFGINAPNIKSVLDEKAWEAVINDVRKSRFWEKKWNYPVYITQALNHHGLNLVNVRGDLEKEDGMKCGAKGKIGEIRSFITNKTWIGNYIRRKITMNESANLNNKHLQDLLYMKTDKDIFTGQRLTFKFVGTGIEKIKDEIETSFQFPKLVDNKNLVFSNFLESCNSVFIHARRGDMLSFNGWCYKYGYFRRATKHIKNVVNNPVFVFFTNTGSIEWCKENAKVFGLDLKKDKVFFVDWNVGQNSYRDLQLMSCCKHGIITNSTFGWWGAYFIKNPNKITISPLAEINTTYHC